MSQIVKENLHQVAKYLRHIKIQLIGDLPHEGQHSLFWFNNCMTTGLLNNQIEVKVDLNHRVFHYHDGEFGHTVRLNQTDTNQNIRAILDEMGLVHPDFGFPNITREEFTIFPQFMNKVFSVLEGYRYSLTGEFTPTARYWPHNFDMDVVQYLHRKGEVVPEIGIGISPGDDFVTDPYIYINVWPFEIETKEKNVPLGEWMAYSEDRYGLIIEWDKVEDKSVDEIIGIIKQARQILMTNFD